jgi:peptide/nickel transport system permease protein
MRSLQTVFLLWFILTFLFFFFRSMPGSYTDLMLQGGASEATIQSFEERWGLNDPLHVQYWTYLTNFLNGDLGRSIHHQQPVWDVVNTRIFNTFILVAPAITCAYILSSILGTVLGNKRGSRLEKYGVMVLVTIGSLPSFFTGIILILIFSIWLNVTPTSGMVSPGLYSQYENWWGIYLTRDFAWHYILPFATIVIRYMYEPTIIMRTSIVEVAGQGFSYLHKITGLPYTNRMRHLGKHAILPVMTLYPISVAQAVSGLVLVEVVFNWPGIGNTLIEAVLTRDTPVIMFVFFVTAAMVVIANFVIDILYGVVDPRVSVSD